jgi:hypothetical protein
VRLFRHNLLFTPSSLSSNIHDIVGNVLDSISALPLSAYPQPAPPFGAFDRLCPFPTTTIPGSQGVLDSSA